VAEQLTRGIGGRHEWGPPKSEAGRRVFAVPEELCDVLVAHVQRRGLELSDSNALLFVNSDNGPLSYPAFRDRRWNPACVAAGVGNWLDEDADPRTRRRYEGVTFHDLRRANATALVADRVDIKTAQRRLGHSDVRTTLELYAQSTSKADREAAEALGERFLPRREAQDLSPGL
jgi:integrase